MELQVTITLSDRLFELLEDKLPNLGRRFEKALTKEIGKQVRTQSEISVRTTPSKKASHDPEAAANGTVGAGETVPDNDRAAVTAEVQTPVPVVKERNLQEEIRAIIHRTRQRFEGEDYLENTGSEAYKKYHRQTTDTLKLIAVELGYPKPSAIDTAEKVDAFAATCDALIIDDNGNISAPPAPF